MRAALVLALVLLTGCASTQSVVPGAASGAEVNTALAGRTVTVLLADGRAVEAQSVTVLPDQTSWFDPGTGELVEVPTAMVLSVSDRSRGRGAAQGALIMGLGTGALMTPGILLDPSDWGFFEDARLLVAVVAGLATGVPAAGVGAGIGYLSGSETRYEVAWPAASAVGPTAAARSVRVGGR